MISRHIDVPQYSDEYWEARSGRLDKTLRLNASSAAAFTPEGHPFITRAQAIRSSVRAWHGADSEFEGNIATQWGTDHEQQAVDWFVLETGVGIAKCGIFLYGDLFATSPDGLIGDKGIAEIKCPFGMRDKEPSEFKWLDQSPHYKVQTTMEMVGAESDYVDFIQWCPQGADFRMYDFDPKHWEYIEPYLRVAREEILAELDNKAHLEPLVKEMHDPQWLDLAAEYINRDRLIKVENERQAKIKEQLYKLAGGDNVKGGGVSVTNSVRKGSVDYKKMLSDLFPDQEVDQDQYRKKSTSIQTVRIGEQS